ncbi:MAG: hypothetical protein Q9219_007021 [cf. Caloplaca sp. 3 TL-2023]
MTAVQELERNVRNAYHVSMKKNLTRDVEILSKRLIPLVESKQVEIAASAQQCKVDFEASKDSIVSRLKPRGQWIASLINNGALPGWRWTVATTVRENALEFLKCDKSAEVRGHVVTSESEIEERIEKDKPYENETPQYIGRLERQAISNEEGPATVVSQTGQSDLITLPDGTVGSKMTLSNRLADGSILTKEFTPESVKLLEEVDMAQMSLDKWLTHPERTDPIMEAAKELLEQNKAYVLELYPDSNPP